MASTKIDQTLRQFYDTQNLDPQLARFAELLVDAPYRAAAKKWLEANPYVPENMQKRRSELAYAACEYNHMLREVILDGRDSFDRASLEGYLTQVTGSSEFAISLVKGVVREIAMFEALKLTEGVEDVQFTDTPTDLQGTDIIFRYKGELVGIDVKSDPNIRKAGLVTLGRDQIRCFTVGVPTQAVDKLKLSKSGERSLVAELGEMLAARN